MFLVKIITPHRRQWLTALSLSVGALIDGTARNWASPDVPKLTAPDNTHPLRLTPSEASWVGSLPFFGRLFGAAIGAAIQVALGALTAGTTWGWASPYIAKLTAPDCTHRLKLTSTEASWIASLVFLGGLCGSTLGAIIQDFIGRKKTLLFMSGPLAVGWALIIIAPTVSWLYASRVLTGIAIGMIFSAAASFLGEISDPMIRGSMIMLTENGVSFGSLLGTIMGGLLEMETFSYVCLGLTGLFISTFVFVPESPYHHISNGDMRMAEKSLKWYKGDVDVQNEMVKLQDFLGSTRISISKRLNEFKKTEHQKSLLIILCVTAFLYCAGQNSTNPYTEVILTKSKVEFTPSVVVMALNFSAIIAGILAMVSVDKLGRRPLLMVSGLGLGVGHILLGSHFHMLSSGTDPESISWLPVFSLFLVYFSIPCGLGTVLCTLIGELFPPILKTPASYAFTATTAILSFAVSKCFQPYLDLVGEKYVFWTFAMSALCSVVFSYFFIPETTRISLIDIQRNLKKDNNETANSGQDAEANVRVKE